VNAGVLFYLYLAGVSVRLLGTRFIETPEISGVRSVIQAVLFLSFFHLGFIRKWKSRNGSSYSLVPIGFFRSDLKHRNEAPRQGSEGAPDAWIDISPSFVEAMPDIVTGQELIIVTWLHEARRGTLKVHPRGDESLPLTGVFSTRSPDRPNPVGLHRVTVREIVGNRIKIGPMEAIDGTPVADVKPVLPESE